MWRVDNCYTHGYVVYYRISRSDQSFIKDVPLFLNLFLTMVFDSFYRGFPFLACGR